MTINEKKAFNEVQL
uniref:Uncharacterized protein n=1 Tax=Anguilla anguilla TaxID=7936 RepID=A0A0E9VUD1_ANGAN